MAGLKVTSHVGRDLLQSAQLFRHEHSVVWEYVSNGLQYKDPGTKPNIVVEIDPKAHVIRVRDNGRGMLLKDLERYFQMHGENMDRKQGKPGRGYFGTGKSAAFGIANSLTLTTVQNGKRSKVRLTRKDIEKTAGEAIPIQILESEAPTTAANGTLIEIEEIGVKNIDISSVIRHIERHIAHWPGATVLVNNHECEFSEPDVSRELRFNTKGTEYEALLGDVTLVAKVSKAPLDDEFKGVAVLSNGVWHETTLAGCERKPFSEYLFGVFDVPALESSESAFPAFDMSRSMKLNPRNEVVAELFRFVGVNLEAIRRDIEKQDRERRQTEEQKRLVQQGSKIAEIINKHFKEWSTKLKSTMAKAGLGSDLMPAKNGSDGGENGAVLGDELKAFIVDRDHIRTDTPIGPEPRKNPFTPGPVPDETAPDKLAKPGQTAPKHRPTGGFNVAFDKIGVNEKRAKYDKETRTIIINLDHPRIDVEAKHVGGQSPVDNPNFLRMAYEIAFTEYAIVLAQELSTIQFFLDPQDALVTLRQTIDDLSKAFAGAWSTSAVQV